MLCAFTLLVLGVVMVNSAGMRVQPLGVDGVQTDGITLESILLSRPTGFMVASLVVMAIASRMPVGWLSDLPKRLLGDKPPAVSIVVLWLGAAVIAGGLMSVYVPGIGKTVNGSARWVELPGAGFSFQPSEIAKWSLPVLLAVFVTLRGPRIAGLASGMLPALIAIGLVAGVVVLEDLGTGVLITAAAGVTLIAGGARLWQLGLIAPIGIAAVGASILSSDYRVRRITAFLDPFEDPKGDGYHMLQSMFAIAGGEGTGRGLGFGLQKFGYLPEDQTDFLFAVVCEELGIAGAAVVVGLFAALLLAGLSIVRNEPRRVIKIAGVGVLATVGFQALINLLVVTGLGPTKGIALPLMSQGGTGWMLTALMLGLLVAADREQADMQLDDQPTNGDLHDEDDADARDPVGLYGQPA